MKRDIVTFLSLQRQIFGICPECEQFFRSQNYDWETLRVQEDGRIEIE
jgi:hypothetical protein